MGKADTTAPLQASVTIARLNSRDALNILIMVKGIRLLTEQSLWTVFVGIIDIRCHVIVYV